MIWVKSYMISRGKFVENPVEKNCQRKFLPSSFSKIKKEDTKQINKTLIQLKIVQNSINSTFISRTFYFRSKNRTHRLSNLSSVSFR